MYARLYTYTVPREHVNEWKKTNQEAKAHFSEQYQKSGYVENKTLMRSRGSHTEVIEIDIYMDRKSWAAVWERSQADPQIKELYDKWLSMVEEYTEEEFESL